MLDIFGDVHCYMFARTERLVGIRCCVLRTDIVNDSCLHDVILNYLNVFRLPIFVV